MRSIRLASASVVTASVASIARASSGVEVEADPARRDEPAQESAARQPLVDLLQRLLHARARRKCRSGSSRRRRCCRCRPRGCRAARARARRCAAPALGAAPRLRRSARPPRRTRARARPSTRRRSARRREARPGREPLDALFQPAMRVEEPCLEVEHRLADRAEAEVARLDDAGVDRPHRHLEDALPFDDQVRELLRGLDRRTLPGVESLSQRVDSPSGQPSCTHQRPRVRVADEHDAEQVLRLALVPVGGRDLVPAIDGTSGRAGSSEATSVTKMSASGALRRRRARRRSGP